MRRTDFWERLNSVLGEPYAESWSRDHVLAELDSQTVAEAFDNGWDTKAVWLAVHRELELPFNLR